MEKNRDNLTQWLFLRSSLKMFLKTNKPWKKRQHSPTCNCNNCFICEGWNKCLVELQKNADKWFKKFDKDFNYESKQ